MLSGEGSIITACLQKLLVRTWSVTDGGPGGRLRRPQIAKDSNCNLVAMPLSVAFVFWGSGRRRLREGRMRSEDVGHLENWETVI